MNKYEQFDRCKELVHDSIELSFSLEKNRKDSKTLVSLQENLDSLLYLLSELSPEEEYLYGEDDD